MRFIRRNENALRKESLAKKLLCKNDKAFWKEIKLMNNSRPNLSLPNVVDGITGSNNTIQYNIVYFQQRTQLHYNNNFYPTLGWLEGGWTEE